MEIYWSIHREIRKTKTDTQAFSQNRNLKMVYASHFQSFPESGSFQMSQFLASGGQSIGVSASTSVLPMNSQDWFPLGWTGWISLLSKGLLQHHSSKASILRHSVFFIVQLSHPYMITGKTIALIRQTFVGKVMSLLFNMLSRLVVTFLPRSKRLVISWLQSPSAVILEPKKIKLLTVSIVSPSICHEVMGPDAMILVSWMLSFKPTFSLSSFTFIKRFFHSSSFFSSKTSLCERSNLSKSWMMHILVNVLTNTERLLFLFACQQEIKFKYSLCIYQINGLHDNLKSHTFCTPQTYTHRSLKHYQQSKHPLKFFYLWKDKNNLVAFWNRDWEARDFPFLIINIFWMF